MKKNASSAPHPGILGLLQKMGIGRRRPVGTISDEDKYAWLGRMLADVSYEMTPAETKNTEKLNGLLPAGSRIYVVHLPNTDLTKTTKSYENALRAGYLPVPHLAARFVPDEATLRTFLGNLQSLGLDEILLLGGGLKEQRGPYRTVMDLLHTGLFEEYGIRSFAVAGHPEPHPYASDEEILRAYTEKYEYFTSHGHEYYMMTQFTFATASLLGLIDTLRAHGLYFPVRAGLVGVVGFQVLIKYAVICGIGNSLKVLRKEAANISNLSRGYRTETFLLPLAEKVLSEPDPDRYAMLQHFHVFPFNNHARSIDYLQKLPLREQDKVTLE